MMIGGLKRSSSSLAILAAAGLFAGGVALTPAQAADLGGDCCADLEERVAELEATTVRSGNRKVRVTLSGHVNTGVWYWDADDQAAGTDTSDVYVMDSGEFRSLFRIGATGTIMPGVTAGLVLEAHFNGDSAIAQTAADDDLGSGFNFRKAEWWINSSMGKVTVGHGSMASDGALEVSFSNAWGGGVGYGLSTSNAGAIQAFSLGTTWSVLATDYDTSRRQRVRYDSPTFAGFTLSVSAGEDDETDVALRYANEFGGVKIAAAGMYYKIADDDRVGATANERWGGSVAVMFNNVHVQGGFSHSQDGVNTATFEHDHWWVAAGFQFRGSSLGMTDITVQYIENDTTDIGNVVGANNEYTSYGIGLGQNIDAIGATFFLSYHRHEADGYGAVNAGLSDELDVVQASMFFPF